MPWGSFAIGTAAGLTAVATLASIVESQPLFKVASKGRQPAYAILNVWAAAFTA
jgi:hypothetical protein